MRYRYCNAIMILRSIAAGVEPVYSCIYTSTVGKGNRWQVASDSAVPFHTGLLVEVHVHHLDVRRPWRDAAGPEHLFLLLLVLLPGFPAQATQLGHAPAPATLHARRVLAHSKALQRRHGIETRTCLFAAPL